MCASSPSQDERLRALHDRLTRADDLARAADVLANHLVAHAGDHDAIDGLCGVVSELRRLLVAARELGDGLSGVVPCGLRTAA
jgi:hypothetical protein